MKVFKIKNSSNYYFMYMKDGKRLSKSTGTSDFDEAMTIMSLYVKKAKEPTIPTLKQELRKYQSIDTNPKYQQSLLDGSHYSLRYAKKIAMHAKKLEEILAKHDEALLNFPLPEINRRYAKQFTQYIVEEIGRCRTAQILQQLLKVVFKEAKLDGIIETSPLEGTPFIKYEENRRNAINGELIIKIISHPEYFSSTQAWAFFTVIATTGMRRSEVLALSKEQVNCGVIIIDRALQDINKNAPIGLPKWGIVRTIPISRLTQKALNSIPININGRYFYCNCGWVQKIFDELKHVLNIVDPQNSYAWNTLTPHVLRHSFNTNMIITGENPLLVAEYCGWEHQAKLLDMQARYTHFVSRHLQPIADAVDRLYEQQLQVMEG